VPFLLGGVMERDRAIAEQLGCTRFSALFIGRGYGTIMGWVNVERRHQTVSVPFLLGGVMEQGFGTHELMSIFAFQCPFYWAGLWNTPLMISW